MDPDLNILLIEDDPSLLAGLVRLVDSHKIGRPFTVSPEAGIEQLASLDPDLAILGPSLNGDRCIKNVQKLKILDPAMSVLTSCTDGCFSKKTAPFLFEGIYHISSNIHQAELQKIVTKVFQDKAEQKIKSDFPMIIGQSQAVIDSKKKLQMVAKKDITLLITGETGTGKELIARSIHYYSPRRFGPLVKVNCGSLPDELLESEIFGFQKGAFTDAHRDKPGRLELADGGTLFIDEIGDLSLNLQVKFLQVLEEKEFTRLGGTFDKAINTRVVAATNADLQKKVRDGSFRKDLFYRLNIIHIEVPPLRKRKEDIPLLVHYFMNKYCYEFKKELLMIPDNITRILMEYHWPGNIRELENVIRRAIALRDWSFLTQELKSDRTMEESDGVSSVDSSWPFVKWGDDQIEGYIRENEFSLKKICKDYISEAERDTIINTLQKTQWNRTKTAQMLQVSYKTLLNRIEEFNLKPK
ncbi:MAG: sigma-54-dependent Fis family transcriptional regulator [Deltaproteobacteria bacterium]|nr:sigma-54-dependent Fis family transcriptional regulator [Deltaproteobacteria bacterium]